MLSIKIQIQYIGQVSVSGYIIRVNLCYMNTQIKARIKNTQKEKEIKSMYINATMHQQIIRG